MPYATLIKRVIASSGEGIDNVVLDDPHAISNNQNDKPWVNVPSQEQTMFVILKILPEEERVVNGETFDIYLKFLSQNNEPIETPSKILVSTASHKLNNFVILASQRITPGLISGPYFAVSMRLSVKSIKKYLMITFRADPEVQKVSILLLSVHARTARHGLSNVMLSQINGNCKQALSIRNLDADPGMGPEASSSLLDKSMRNKQGEAEQPEIQVPDTAASPSKSYTYKTRSKPTNEAPGEEQRENQVQNQEDEQIIPQEQPVTSQHPEKHGRRKSKKHSKGKAEEVDLEAPAVDESSDGTTSGKQQNDKGDKSEENYEIPQMFQPITSPVKAVYLDGHKLKNKEVSFDGKVLSGVTKGCRSMKKNPLWQMNETSDEKSEKKNKNPLIVMYGLEGLHGAKDSRVLTLITWTGDSINYTNIGIAFKNPGDCCRMASALILTQGKRVSPGQLIFRRILRDNASNFATKIKGLESKQQEEGTKEKTLKKGKK